MTQTAPQRYQVLERLDAGGMAEVFKGKVTSIQGFEKLVAIKRILPDLTKDERFVRMFLDEAKLSLHLNHANIVQVFDIGQSDGTYFIVMEFVNGLNLKNVLNSLLQAQQKLPIEQAVFIAMEVCKGLAYAHERLGPDDQPLKIVHRDISPPNILISRNGEVRVTDFGLAKAVIQVEHTDPGIVKGKFGYLSPEAAHGQPIDHLTDIFAVGICLWEMIACQRLFLGASDLDTLKLVRQCEVPSLKPHQPHIPPELEAIIQKSLHPDKSQRYASAKEFGEALTRFLFSYGKVVTNYDISQTIQGLMGGESKPSIPVAVGGAQNSKSIIDILIQNEIDRFISIEELEDLNEMNLVGAREFQFDPNDHESNPNSLPSVGFEDPRTWSDVLGDDPGGSVELDLSAASPGLTAKRPALPQALPSAPQRPRVHKTPERIKVPAAPPIEDDGPSKMAWMLFGVLLILLLGALGYLITTLK